MRNIWAFLMVFGAAIVAAPRAYGMCGVSTPMFDSTSFFACKDTDSTGAPANVAALAWQISLPTTSNTGGQDIACEAVGFDGGACIGGGPGQVIISTDWGDPLITGCPVVSGVPQRIALVVQAVDGTGALISVSGSTVEFGYAPDLAHPFDPSTQSLLPILCDASAGAPSIVSETSTSLSLKFAVPRIYTDCDATSLGQAGFTATNPCADGFVPNIALSKIYTSVQACGTHPDIRRSSWTLNPVVPNATGSATITIQRPTMAGLCLFVGGTVVLGGQESGAITGFVQLVSAPASSPLALDVSATQVGGDVNVSFRTNTEVGLAAINILTEEKTKGLLKVSSVQPKGVDGAGASYQVSIARGAFKSGRTVIVETVTIDGRSFKSAPVRF